VDKLLGKFRKKYEEAMIPVGRFLGKLGFSPNIFSILSVVAGALCLWFFYSKNLIIGAFLIISTGILDMFDGAIARATGKITKFGGVLDHVLDRYVEYLIVMGIILSGYVDWLWGVFTLFGMIMASFTRAKAESVGGLKNCSVGIAERQEKLIILIVGTLLSVFYIDVLTYAVILVGVLSHLTVIQRLKYTWEQTRSV